MTKPAWKPWHEVMTLREDVRSGELPLATFAADLYQVMIGQAKPVYQDPRELFSLTYPGAIARAPRRRGGFPARAGAQVARAGV